MSSAGIIADKLAAGMLLVLVPMAAVLPALALIGMLGGIDPGQVVTFYGQALAAAWMTAAVAMLVSVHARTPAGAVAGSYAAGLAWIFVPIWAVEWIESSDVPMLSTWVGPVVRLVARSSPLAPWFPFPIWGPLGTKPGMRPWLIVETATIEAAAGTVLFALAALRLRPAYRARLDARAPGRRGRLARLLGLRNGGRPPCGDDPIAWKERHAPESALLARLAVLVGLAVVADATIFDVRWNRAHRDFAFDELFRYGLEPGPWGTHLSARNGMNYVLCEKAGLLFTFAVAGVALAAASGIAGERSRGTWGSLLATPLDRAAIMRAKTWGAVRAVRVLLGLALVFYAASLATTAMHPLGFVLGVVAVASFIAFAAALGTYVSLYARDAGRAIGWTVATLAALDLVPAAALFFGPGGGGHALMVTTPMLVTILPVSRMQAYVLVNVERIGWVWFAIASGIVLSRAVGAWALARASARRITREGIG
jgi:hypothetical protein